MEALKLLVAGIGMGWGPCLALSGPVLLPYIAATEESWRGGLRTSAAFSLGRLLALAILGGLATVAFASINRFFPPHRSGYLHLAVAVFIILMGALIALGRGFKVPLYHAPREHVVDNRILSTLILGFLIAISPCATLVAILTYITCVATSVVQGVVYALSFGVGTVVPLMILGPLVGFLPGRILRSARFLKVLRVVCGAILILFGLQLLYCVWQVL